MNRQPTIYDVAERAGVGIATVSRALRGSAPVAEATRIKVERAVAELGFRPSHLGTSLAQGTHAANGIVFPDLSGPYYAEVLLGYEEAASRLGRSVLVQATQGRDDAEQAVRDLADRVDGLVLLGRTVPDEVVEEIQHAGTPVVLLARDPAGPADCLRSDNEAGAIALGRHLAAHGYPAVRFLGAPDASPDAAARLAGITAALAPQPVPVVPCGFDETSGYRAAREVLDTLGPDA
ncbi:MAG: LacI family transcriptional regulator, partial [Cellulomonadaceae bacterium]|nr:LacI family transcriptional regulator [Cellulomonadaceae bacterium]